VQAVTQAPRHHALSGHRCTRDTAQPLLCQLLTHVTRKAVPTKLTGTHNTRSTWTYTVHSPEYQRQKVATDRLLPTSPRSMPLHTPTQQQRAAEVHCLHCVARTPVHMTQTRMYMRRTKCIAHVRHRHAAQTTTWPSRYRPVTALH
jgi:hypothetical protein